MTKVNLPDLQSPASFSVDALGDIYYLGSSSGFEEKPACNGTIQDLLGPDVYLPNQVGYYLIASGFNPTLFDMALDPFGDIFF